MKFSLCGGKSCCPKVVSTENGIEIGEKDNLVKLNGILLLMLCSKASLRRFKRYNK